MGRDHGLVEIPIVDLIEADQAEELGAVHVDGDLVAVTRVERRVGDAGEGGAGGAGVEARGGGGPTRGAAGELIRVSSDRDPTRDPDLEAGLECSEGARVCSAGSEGGEV